MYYYPKSHYSEGNIQLPWRGIAIKSGKGMCNVCVCSEHWQLIETCKLPHLVAVLINIHVFTHLLKHVYAVIVRTEAS